MDCLTSRIKSKVECFMVRKYHTAVSKGIVDQTVQLVKLIMEGRVSDARHSDCIEQLFFFQSSPVHRKDSRPRHS